MAGRPNDGATVFDRGAVRAHRARAAAAPEDSDFLHREVAARLLERLGDVKRTFPLALDLGCHGGALARCLVQEDRVGTVICTDLAPALVARAGAASGASPVAADEEFLPFAAGTFDLVASGLALHWVNDLPGTLVQVRRALKPDGLFLASFFGAGTLVELRDVFLEVEAERGAGPRVAPFADIRDAGALLQRAGFALPVADRDRITLTYGSALALMRELRAMGESNAVAGRRRGFSRRETFARAAALYEERYADEDGRIRASFEIITLTAWAPDASQPRPLKPGSAKARLADALGEKEIPAGEKAGRKDN